MGTGMADMGTGMAGMLNILVATPMATVMMLMATAKVTKRRKGIMIR